MAAGTPKRRTPRSKFVVVMSLLAVLLVLPWSIAMYRGHQGKQKVLKEIYALDGIAKSKYH